MNSRKEYMRQYYLKNKDKTIAYTKARNLEKPEIRQSWLKENGHKPKVRFDKAKSNITTKRKKVWDLTFEEYSVIIANKCHYCDCDISQERGSGLDRLDNDKGYTKENVVPCCGVCNNSRNENFTPEEWKIGIQAILEFRKMGQKC